MSPEQSRSRETTTPPKEYFGGVLRTFEQGGKLFATIQINGEYRNIPLSKNTQDVASLLTQIKENWILFDAANDVFYDPKIGAEKIVQDLRTSSFEKIQKILPNKHVTSFSREEYSKCMSLLQKIGQAELAEMKSSMGRGLNHAFILMLCVQSIRANPSNPISYFRDVVALWWFTAGVMTLGLGTKMFTEKIAAEVLKKKLLGITSRLPWFIGKITGLLGALIAGMVWAELFLKISEILGAEKIHLSNDPGRYLYAETPESVLGKAITMETAGLTDAIGEKNRAFSEEYTKKVCKALEKQFPGESEKMISIYISTPKTVECYRKMEAQYPWKWNRIMSIIERIGQFRILQDWTDGSLNTLGFRSWVDASENPMDWTARSVGRDVSKWNTQVDAFKKRAGKELIILISQYFNEGGPYKKVSTLEKSRQTAEKKAIFIKEFRKTFSEKTNNDVMDFMWNSLFSGIQEDILKILENKGITNSQTSLNSLLEYIGLNAQNWTLWGTLNQDFNAMKIAEHFDPKYTKIDPIHYKIWASQTDESSTFLVRHKDNATNVKNARNHLYEILSKEDFQIFNFFLFNILQGQHPFGKGKENDWELLKKWRELLGRSNKIDSLLKDEKWAPILIDLGQYLVNTYNTAAEIRKMNRFMELVNKNGYGNEWQMVPSGRSAKGAISGVTLGLSTRRSTETGYSEEMMYP